MRGRQSGQGGMFSYVAAEDWIPQDHPIRKVRAVVDRALANMDDV